MATKTRPAPPRVGIGTLLPGDDQPGQKRWTIGDYIVEQVKAGVDPINAAGAAGVMPAELTAWTREGALVFARLSGGALWERDFTPEQQDCAWFADALVKAHAQHISRLALVSEQAARGTLPPRVSTRTKSVGGQIVEVVTTSETLMPDLDMVKWKLERLEPGVYGQRATLNVNVTDLTDTDVTEDVIARRMAAVAAALVGELGAGDGDAVIDVTSSDDAVT